MATKNYLHGHHASVLRSHSWRTVQNSAPHLIPHLTSPTLKILDVGCGPGTISVDLAQRVPQGFVYAIDPSEAVIEKARQHAAEKGVSNIRFEVGDIFNWEALDGVEEKGFDIVHAHQVLQHLQDPLGAMKEMKRLTKPGGIVAVRDADYSAFTWYPEIPGLRKWSALYLKAAQSIGCDPNIGRRLHAVALEAGFDRKDIEASAAVWVFSTPEERKWWCGLWAERTLQSEFKHKVLEKGLGTVEDLEAIAESFRELEGREDGWFSAMNGQVICHVRDP
ncbi:S-adenosyl-L-methionine-dependent methyltransferase [Westerdykella ornata]|uniref:S-adenosyl-L-methionine-dependent methyltransferase n=1 Tax=Westerdykella ornata TaxID=318751 RepID=A0A6A6JAU5_WESOR|nr:S-adenosyl-L-methionine-dependent methyltransferase [Westerdykella ornata]KAF2273721.1 S-adenosyl-L-methionine-dependent methyltransferase [Westerdykella ornata]